MFFKRKVYETGSQKVGDFFFGIALFVGINIAFGVIAGLGSSIFVSLTGASGNPTVQAFWNMALFLISILPFVIQIGLIIYFGLTRYWIALGMLGAFAASLLLVLLFVAFCFALIYGFNR